MQMGTMEPGMDNMEDEKSLRQLFCLLPGNDVWERNLIAHCFEGRTLYAPQAACFCLWIWQLRKHPQIKVL